MSAEAVDEYVRALEEPKRSTLQTLRRTILEIVPEAGHLIGLERPEPYVEALVRWGRDGR